jgi:hypothetical protein
MLHFLYGFMARDSGGKDVFVQSPRLTDRASALPGLAPSVALLTGCIGGYSDRFEARSFC